MIRKLINSVLPRGIQATAQSYKILSADFGHYKSVRRWECVDASDAPVPWYSYPATEYIKQLDFSDRIIFEYGSGNSTRFWAERCKRIVSVEDDKEWYDKIEGQLPAHAEYQLLEGRQEYVKSINNYPDGFDLIIIDGSYRYECAVEAIGKLRDDGLIVLDNSDWYEKTSELLRNSDLIEVDMSGFGPINPYTWTTSFYFTRNVRLTPAYDRQPMHGIGSLKQREA
jgi:hypothetical protein